MSSSRVEGHTLYVSDAITRRAREAHLGRLTLGWGLEAEAWSRAPNNRAFRFVPPALNPGDKA